MIMIYYLDDDLEQSARVLHDFSSLRQNQTALRDDLREEDAAGYTGAAKTLMSSMYRAGATVAGAISNGWSPPQQEKKP